MAGILTLESSLNFISRKYTHCGQRSSDGEDEARLAPVSLVSAFPVLAVDGPAHLSTLLVRAYINESRLKSRNGSIHLLAIHLDYLADCFHRLLPKPYDSREDMWSIYVVAKRALNSSHWRRKLQL